MNYATIKKHRWILALAACVAIIAIVIITWRSSEPVVAPEAPIVSTDTRFKNGVLGLEFSYPVAYMAQTTAGNGVETTAIVTVIHQDDIERRPGSEAPRSVEIVVYPRQEDATLDDWLAQKVSNFELSDGTYSETVIDGAPARSYRWSGLYEGETMVFIHDQSFVSVSATSITPQDDIRAAYKMVLETMSLSIPEPLERI